MTNAERWSWIQFAPGYMVSTNGRVKSFRLWGGHIKGPKRTNRYGVGGVGRLLRQKTGRDGYKYVSLCINKKTKGFGVHRLVALTFTGVCPSFLHEVRHLDGNTTNNNSLNLAWGTKKENGEDKVRHDNSLYGERNSEAKLTESQVLAIKKELLTGISYSKLAYKYGVSIGSIGNIKHNRTWAYLLKKEVSR